MPVGVVLGSSAFAFGVGGWPFLLFGNAGSPPEARPLLGGGLA